MTQPSRSKVLTVMLIDIVDYTRMSSRLERERFDELNEVFDRLALPVFDKYGGWVVKKIGDSFLVAFDSATDSLHCAVELQNRFWEYNEDKPDVPIKIKVAVNTGEVIVKGKDIYGEPVTVVSKLEKETVAGQIYFSNSVFLAMNKSEIPYVYVGKRRVKGVDRPVDLFRVKGFGEDAIVRRKRITRNIWATTKLVIFLAILGVGGYYLVSWLISSGVIDQIGEAFRQFGDEIYNTVAEIFG